MWEGPYSELQKVNLPLKVIYCPSQSTNFTSLAWRRRHPHTSRRARGGSRREDEAGDGQSGFSLQKKL